MFHKAFYGAKTGHVRSSLCTKRTITRMEKRKRKRKKKKKKGMVSINKDVHSIHARADKRKRTYQNR